MTKVPAQPVAPTPARLPAPAASRPVLRHRTIEHDRSDPSAAPTLRSRLEAAFSVTNPTIEPAIEQGAEAAEPEAPRPVDAETPKPAEARVPEVVDTRERIKNQALASRENEAPAPAAAAPVQPVAAPAATPPPPVAETPAEPEVELGSDEAVAAGVSPDTDQHKIALRTAEPSGDRPPPALVTRPYAPSLAEAHPVTVRISPEQGMDAPEPQRETEPKARGPPDPEPALTIQTKLSVSNSGDPLEREADEVSARVVQYRTPLPAPGLAPAEAVQRVPASARRGSAPVRRLPGSVVSVVTSPGGGLPMAASLRARIEPHVGIDLGHVRVRTEPAAALAARDLRARAFTSGSTIFLAAESSPNDLALMAHEAAHVAQQDTSANARTTLMRDVTDYLPDVSATDLIPDWILDGVRSAIRSIPGYTLLTYITGTDPLTDQPVNAGPEEIVEKLLTYGPFGAAVGPVLQTIEVLGEVFDFVSSSFAAHNLTFERIKGDVERAWDEFSVSSGISGNVAIVDRYVSAFLRDVRAFVDSIVDRVIEMVRAVVAEVAEPLLQTPEVAPIWNLTKKVLHYDPLKGESVDAPTAEIIADFLRLIGQEQRLAQMEERGTLQETADWLDTQFETFIGLIGELGSLFRQAWAAIQPANLPNLMENLADLAQRAFGFIQRVGEFAATIIAKILEIIKDALLGWLSEHAHSIPGFHLLTVIIGQNPFTGEDVPRTAENLIKGFITLLPGGEETYNQLVEAGVIGDAAGRIEGEMTRLGISLNMVTGLFHSIWSTLSLDDLLDPLGAFGRILDLFGEPLSRLIEFIVVVIEVVITLILRLMNFPSDLLGSIIANAVQAIEDIKRDPVGFLKNMLAAVKQGLTGFFDNILTYLLQGLAAWLFRGLGALGIQIPSDLSLQSILTLVLQVLGISIESLWTKLGQHIGPERVAMIRGAIDRLTGAWEFIKDVQQNGISAVWRFVTDQLSNLWDTLLDMAKDWIMQTIVARVTARLISMLDPTGVMAVVNSFIAFFNAVQSAIEYLRDILEIINRWVSTLAAVAAGNIGPGAAMLESGLAAAIPVAIGFLANQVGLGNIPEKVVEIIGGLRRMVDQALDWLIQQALRLGRAVLNALGLGPEQQPPAEPGAGGPKKQAQDLLRTRLQEAKSQQEIGQIVSQVRNELQPSGLQALELRGPGEHGDFEVFASASEFEKLVELIPALGGPRSVVMEVTLQMHQADVSLEGEPGAAATRLPVRDAAGNIQFDDQGRPVMATSHYALPPVIERGRTRTSRTTSGGVALPPAAGSGQIQLLTYNTSEDPRSDSNASHAERQFEEFLERSPRIKNGIREIYADINYSPCTLCSSTLSTISRITPNAARRNLRWHDVYRHPTRGTTDASLGAASGWHISPGAVTAEGLAELEASEWASVSSSGSGT